MLKFVLRVLRFAGEYAARLKLSFVLSFVEGLLQSVPILLIWQALDQIMTGTLQHSNVWIYSIILPGTVGVRILLRYWFVALESGAGYEICERERIALGNKLRHFPMGFFSEGNLGRVASIITVDLPFIEEMGMDALDKVIGGYATSFIAAVLMFIVDWRIGLITIAVFGIAGHCFCHLERVSKKQSPIRQRQQSELVSAILEYVQGIAVIKSFNMQGEKAARVKKAIDETRDHAADFEAALLSPTFAYKMCFAVGTTLTILMASLFSIHGEMSTSMAAALFIFVFSLYTPATAFAGLSSQLRIMEAALDRYEGLISTPTVEEPVAAAQPENFSISFEQVGFAYGTEKILDGISFNTGEKTITALVGPSGGGKTTIANLIVRFWDVQEGSIKIGGTDIRNMSSNALLSNISMVFQNVHLFNDTVLNNIRFGKPDATTAEISAAAKKAQCHDFITTLPDGYNTVIGENGGLLSGGERQRISIARAILKDAPIIILDEATASVDPDNEMEIQQAIGALIENKTLIIIAHRLSTIQKSNQILVIENKGIAERGTHEELLMLKGRYAALWNKRVTAGGWQIIGLNNNHNQPDY